MKSNQFAHFAAAVAASCSLAQNYPSELGCQNMMEQLG
jgi:hypothetical protein